jgi:hypothetical protein
VFQRRNGADRRSLLPAIPCKNYDIWYKEEKEDDHRLTDTATPPNRTARSMGASDKEAELKKSKVRIYFNNHARTKSVRNTFLLMDLTLIDHKQKEIKS